jgi:hypothetical protein
VIVLGCVTRFMSNDVIHQGHWRHNEPPVEAKPPEKYFKDLIEQCDGGKKKYGGITDTKLLRANLKAHCIPDAMIKGEIPTFSVFLEERRKLMALKIKDWFNAL